MNNDPNSLDVLIIEDNPADAFLLKEMLKSSQLQINNLYTTERIAEALEFLGEKDVHLALLDLSLPDSMGLNSFLGIKQATNKIPVIILTGLTDMDTAIDALKEGAQDYLVKGDFNASHLTKAIQYSLERKRIEEQVKESEIKYRQIFQRNPFPSWVFDMNSHSIVEVNPAAEEKYGYSREELIGMKMDKILFADDRPHILNYIENITTHDIKKTECRHVKKNGEIIICETTCYPINYYGSLSIQIQINDITEKRRLEKQLLLQQQKRQRQITAAVMRAQEKERTAIGQELHDNVNQLLSAVKMYLGIALKGRPDREESMLKAMTYTTNAIEEIRQLSKTLVSPSLSVTGLGIAVEELVSNMTLLSSIEFDVDHKNMNESIVAEDLKISIYRIIQEQLSNILKHSKANTSSIHLSTSDNIQHLLIQDDGVGFDLAQKRKGVGITSILNRAQVFNGKAEFETAPGEGCTLRIDFNLKENPIDET